MSAMPEWQDRTAYTPVPVEEWGRDHFSLLLFVESRGVDYKGRLDWDCVRVSKRGWPMLYAMRRHFGSTLQDPADAYPIRLAGHTAETPNERYGICEADCLIDMREAGVLTISMPKADRERDVWLAPGGHPIRDMEFAPSMAATGLAEWALMPWAKFALTEAGQELAARLRAHRASSGAVSTFKMGEV